MKEERVKIPGRKAALTVQKNLPPVHIQKTRAYQLFRNLISNSIKFAREDIPLKIEVGMSSENGDRIPEGHGLFFVRDNGKGIEKRYHKKIFGLFARPVPQIEHGTGVGLAIVKRIIEEEGGNVWVDSVPGEGSTFYFSLPVDQRTNA